MTLFDGEELVRRSALDAAEFFGRVRAWGESDVEVADDDGPGFDWDDGPEPPPSRRVVTIETTGDRL